MARITFKTKAVRELLPDNSATDVHIIPVPDFQRRHCDMAAFRAHPKFGSFANSDLFPSILKRIKREVAPHSHIRTDKLPANVTVDLSGFLAVVTVDV